jgi:hypothetical protein
MRPHVGEAADKTKPDRIFGGGGEDERGCCLGRERGGRVACNDHCDLPANHSALN